MRAVPLGAAQEKLRQAGDAARSAEATLRERVSGLSSDVIPHPRRPRKGRWRSPQQARETLERQLKDHAIEAHRVRTGLEDEIKRLTAAASKRALLRGSRSTAKGRP